MSIVAFPGRSLLPAIGDVVTHDGERCVVHSHSHRWDGGPSALLLHILTGPHAGTVYSAELHAIQIGPELPADPSAGSGANPIGEI